MGTGQALAQFTCSFHSVQGPAKFRVNLPTLINTVKRIPHRHPYRPKQFRQFPMETPFQGILDSVKLTIKTDYHSAFIITLIPEEGAKL